MDRSTSGSRRRYRLAGASLAILGAAITSTLPLTASAQSAAPPVQDEASQVDDIVVSARRREERLQDVPVAVTALSAEALEDRGVTEISEVAKFTPNIRFDGAAALSGGNYNATVFIRGVGQNDFATFSDPGVGTYIDGVYFARSIGGMLDAFDVGRIEVLRGPQGTLFGKNTIGGAVVITSQQPSADLGGHVDATIGSFSRADLRGHIDVPLADGKLLTRLSAATLNREGYARRLSDGQDLGDKNADAARLQALWMPTEMLTVSFSADYTRAREHSAPNTLLTLDPNAVFIQRYNTFVAPSRGVTAPNGQGTLNTSWITGDPYTTWASGPNVNDLDLWGTSVTADWNLGPVDLKSIMAYRELEAVFARDGDNTPFTYRETYNADEQSQFSQEFQLSGLSFADRLSWVAGVFYFREDSIDVGRADLAVGLQPPTATVPPFSPAVNILTEVEAVTYAAFAQGTFSITDQLSVTMGGRYNVDDKTYTLDHRRQRDGFIVANLTRSNDWDSFTPKVGVEFKPNSDVLVYGSIGQGFKSGGYNARPLAGPDEVTIYEPETIVTYELGAKTSWFDRRMTLNGAAYFSKYDDIQLTVNQTPQNFVANAAAGEIKGFELELIGRPTSSLDVNLAVGYLKTEYTEVGQGLGPTQILPITLATPFLKAPEWTVAAGAQYRFDLPQGDDVTVRADYAYYSEVFNDIAGDPLLAQDAYGLLNIRATYTSRDGSWRASVFGTNVTDVDYKQSGNASAGFGLREASFARPAEWGLSLGKNF